MITIRDVAKLAGVAPITVSRVVNRLPGVTDATRARVEKAIADLHYVPNAMAKSLRSKQTHTIALVLSDVTNPFWTTVARGVEDVAAQRGFHVILCNTDENREKEAKYIGILLERRVDGIIIAATTSEKKNLAPLKRQNVSCVLIDRRVEGFKADAVRSDGITGARHLVEHLLNLGHRHIAIVMGPEHVSTSDERFEGFCQALQEHGLSVEPNLVKLGSYKQDTSDQIVSELLLARPRPTAIFAFNNLMAVGVLKALREAGLGVPEDMALVCFDDIPHASLIYPFLTVCAQDANKMGVVSAELLIDRIQGKAHPRKFREIILDTQLIVRKSCGQGLHSPGKLALDPVHVSTLDQ